MEYCNLAKYLLAMAIGHTLLDRKLLKINEFLHQLGIDPLNDIQTETDLMNVLLKIKDANLTNEEGASVYPVMCGGNIARRNCESTVQTVSYLPHFLSWAIYGGLLKTIISADNGAFNRLLMAVGLISSPKEWIADPNCFWAISIISGLLKDLGWSAIIYLAAIAGVDPTLYEVVEIDGGNRFHKMWHVTMPAILPTVMVMLIFAISGMLNNNFTQVYILQNTLNMKASNVIDTYIYQIGMQKYQFNIATAAGLAKSVFALILLFGANFASRKLTDHSLF